MPKTNQPDYEQLKKQLARYNEFENPLKQKLWVLCVITKALEPHQIKPILIGGCALEYYTLGGHSTYDIDIAVADHQQLSITLDRLGFHKEGRFWNHSNLDIVIESPAGSLVNETAPLTEVHMDGLKCFIIGLEDLIIDRLNGYVHWKWEDDGRYVKLMLKTYVDKINWQYLEKRSQQEQTHAILQQMKKEIS